MTIRKIQDEQTNKIDHLIKINEDLMMECGPISGFGNPAS